MLGAIIGDIVGSIYERDNIKTKDFMLFNDNCTITDDTLMTIAVADALLNGGSEDDFINSMKKYGRLYINCGYGFKFYNWLITGDRKPYNSYGNGSAMRVSPCAWFANSLEEAEMLAEKSAVVTHNHPEGIKGAQATASAIYLARTNESKDNIKEYIEKRHGYDLNRTLDEIRPTYRFNASCQKTVPEAIISFLECNSFEDAVRNAISLGGDSDTLAAIAGSIAEACYLIDSYSITRAFNCLDDTLSEVINRWLDRGCTSRSVLNKTNWKTSEFSKPKKIAFKLHITENQYARIRFGLRPEEMEDKWFAYFKDNRIHFHRSWTGYKIFEAYFGKSEEGYFISEIIVERDEKLYGNTEDDEDIKAFYFLLGRGILGLNISLPLDSEDADSVIKGWSSFGRMIL